MASPPTPLTMSRVAQAARHLAGGYPGLALIAAGMQRARAERLSYAYQVDQAWPARVVRLTFYVTIRLGSRLAGWTELAAWSERSWPGLHGTLRHVYRSSLRPQPPWAAPPRDALAGPAQRRVRHRLDLMRLPVARPQQWIDRAGPAERRIRQRLARLSGEAR